MHFVSLAFLTTFPKTLCSPVSFVTLSLSLFLSLAHSFWEINNKHSRLNGTTNWTMVPLVICTQLYHWHGKSTLSLSLSLSLLHMQTFFSSPFISFFATLLMYCAGNCLLDVFSNVFSQCLHRNMCHLYAVYFFFPFCLLSVNLLLTWQLYDIDGDGKLTLNEIQEIARAIYNLLGYYVTPPYDKVTSDQHAARIFTKLDRSRKGFLLKDEFVDICSRVSVKYVQCDRWMHFSSSSPFALTVGTHFTQAVSFVLSIFAVAFTPPICMTSANLTSPPWTFCQFGKSDGPLYVCLH